MKSKKRDKDNLVIIIVQRNKLIVLARVNLPLHKPTVCYIMCPLLGGSTVCIYAAVIYCTLCHACLPFSYYIE